MIDKKLLEKEFDTVATALEKKGVSKEILEDLKNRTIITKSKRQNMEAVQAEQKQLSNQFGAYKKEGLDIAPLKEQIDKLKDEKQKLEDEVRTDELAIDNIIMGIPNMPDDTVPVGADENENVILEIIGEKPTFTFEPKEHWELGENNGMIDFTRGVKLA